MSHPRERLSAFLDGELSASERAELESHLRTCAECAREIEELAAVDQAARSLAVEAPAGYFDALPARVRARVRRPRRWIPAALGVAAAAVLVAVVAPLTLTRARALVAAPPASAGRPAAEAPAPRVAGEAAPALTAQDAPASDDSQALKKQTASGRAVADRANKDAEPPLARREIAPRLLARDRLQETPPEAPKVARADADVAAGNVAAAEEKPAAAEDALTAEAAPPATAGARSGVMAARERKPPVPGRLAAPPDPARLAAERYQSLLDQRPATVADARALRDGWEAFVRDQPSGPHADEARVRAIEAGATAWRLGGDVADLDRTRAAADAYLAVADAPQRLRVRAVREALPD